MLREGFAFALFICHARASSGLHHSMHVPPQLLLISPSGTLLSCGVHEQANQAVGQDTLISSSPLAHGRERAVEGLGCEVGCVYPRTRDGQRLTSSSDSCAPAIQHTALK